MINNFARYKEVESNLIIGDENFNTNPMVTIAIPAYKRPKPLKEAINSALSQKNFCDYEVIIVDDDPDNELNIERLINTYPRGKIKYYRNEKNLGLFGNWNRCVELAKGTWISLLHDDDYLRDDFLSTWYQIIKNNKTDYLMFDVEQLDTKNHLKMKRFKTIYFGLYKPVIKLMEKIFPSCPEYRKLDKIDFLLRNQSTGVGAVLKKEKVIFAGGFNEDFYPSADVFFWLQSLDKGVSIHKHSKRVAVIRMEDNTTLKKETIFGFIDKISDITRLALGNRNDFISRTLIDANRNFLALVCYFKKLISKDELKQRASNVIRSCIIMHVFKMYYFLYTRVFFIKCNNRNKVIKNRK